MATATTTRAHWSTKLPADACGDAVTWARTQPSANTAWTTCERPDWMLWLLGRLVKTDDDRKAIVLVTCACARTSLKYVKAGETRPLKAIETAEAWCRGEATIEQVREARRASADAADAASASADAFASAFASADASAAASASADAAAAASAYASAYAASAAASAAYAADAFASAYAADAFASAYAAFASAYAASAADAFASAYAAFASASASAASAAAAAAAAAARSKARNEMADIVRAMVPMPRLGKSP